MNLAMKPSDFDISYVHFLDLKKNTIIDGNYSKIVYKDPNVVFNGVYLYFRLYCHETNNDDEYKMCLTSQNKEIIKSLTVVEEQIIHLYKSLYKNTKYPVYALKTQLDSGYLKAYKSIESTVLSNIYVLRITGIWENKKNIGIAYKIMN